MEVCGTRWRTVQEQRPWESSVVMHVPPECVEPGSVTIVTAADEYPPITYPDGRTGPPASAIHFASSKYVGGSAWVTFGPSVYVPSTADDWWILIACSDSGVITGQFAGRDRRKRTRRIRGSFVAHP